MPRELTQPIIEQWITLVGGTFNVRDIWAELDIKTPQNRQHLRVILSRLEHSNIIVKTSRDGLYRKLNLEARPIDWQRANPKNVLPIILPFGIHEHVRIYPKSIIIVAGSKNEGKTAFLYQTIKLNMSNFIIDLFNSETGPEQMKERFESLEIPEPSPFNTYERYDNFADIVNAEHMSVIDYLDVNSEVYLVGAEIDAIFRKLTNGVAIIGLQKPPPTVAFVRGVKKVYDRDLAYGGGFTAKRAILYISMGSHKLKLLYVKTPANPRVNPNNMTWNYDFDDNGYFTAIQRYYPSEDNL